MQPSASLGQTAAEAVRFRCEHGADAASLARAYASAFLSIGDTGQARLWRAVASLLGGIPAGSER